MPFFSLSGSEFVEMFVGVGAARVRDLFSQAEQKAPCIIFIDELDALGRARVQSPMGSHEEREQTLNQLLAEMDGFDSRKAIIIMAATNRPEVLDPALLRPGRFDRQVLVDKPDVKGREEVLRIHTKNVKLAPTVDLQGRGRAHGRLCRRRPRQSGQRSGAAGRAQGQDVGRDAGLRRGDRSPDRRPREEARDEPEGARDRRLPRVGPRDRRDGDSRHGSGAQDLDRAARLRRARLHDAAAARGSLSDAAHAICCNQLAVLLGGRTAEEIALGEISTGAQNDLQRATDIARAMVTEWGMSDALGAINYDGHKRSKFLDIPIGPERGAYAEDTARLIDSEVKRIMTDAHDKARAILTEKRDMLETVTRRLLEDRGHGGR